MTKKQKIFTAIGLLLIPITTIFNIYMFKDLRDEIHNQNREYSVEEVVEILQSNLPQVSHHNSVDIITDDIHISGDSVIFHNTLKPLIEITEEKKVELANTTLSALTSGDKELFLKDYESSYIIQAIVRESMVYTNEFQWEGSSQKTSHSVCPDTYKEWF